MDAVLRWYVLGVVLLFVALFAAAGYYDTRASGDAITQRTGTPTGWYLAAGFVGVVAAGVVAVNGSIPEGFGGRAEMVALLVHVAPLVTGFGGLAAAVSNGLVLARLSRADATDAEGVAARQPGERIAVTGVVTEPEGESPVFGREAACWTWKLELGWEDRDVGWQTDQVGSGGAPFALADDTGSVTVDPGDAHVDVRGGRTEVYDADAAQPGRVGADLRSSIAGDRYRYSETAAADGRRLTVLGTLGEDGAVLADWIVDADADVVGRRYAGRTGVLAVGSLLAIVVGLRLTASYFGTPLPF